MIKNLLIFAIIFSSTQFAFSQQNRSTKLRTEISEAFDNGNYDLTIHKVNELETITKQVPPVYLALRIKALNAIIIKNPYQDYQRIDYTRKLVTKYLNNPLSRKNDNNYDSILGIIDVLNTYPKTETAFMITKKAREQEAIDRKKQEILEAEIKRKKDLRDNIIRDSILLVRAAEAKLKFTKDSIQAIAQAKIDAKEREVAAVKQAEQRKIQDKIDKANARRYNFRNNTFSNIGAMSGEIAKFGLLFEHGGGNNFLGYHLAIRSSLTKEGDVISGKEIENKTEFNIGPNFKISNYVYLNLGAGYGFYNYPNRNDYLGQPPTIEKQTYLVTSGGLMFRLGRLVNISAGVSFMDIDKGFYTPEIIGGLTFNLKSN